MADVAGENPLGNGVTGIGGKTHSNKSGSLKIGNNIIHNTTTNDNTNPHTVFGEEVAEAEESYKHGTALRWKV